LISAIVWFEMGMLLAAGRVLLEGADPAGASTGLLVGPLVLGWMGLALLGSATHLVPAVGPGDPQAHGRQRRLLGRAAWPRLVLANLGIAAVALGLPADLGPLSSLGLAAVAISLGTTAALVVGAVAVGLRNVHASSTSSS
jgi:hypothetical protein